MRDEPLREALQIARDVREQMARGAAPAKLIGRLEALLRRAPAAEPERRVVAALLAELESARRDGRNWLEQVLLPELEVLSRRQEANAAYRKRGSSG